MYSALRTACSSGRDSCNVSLLIMHPRNCRGPPFLLRAQRLMQQAAFFAPAS